MNEQKNSYKIKDIILWLAMVVTTILALYITYNFKISAPIKSLVWLLWVIASISIGWYTSQGKKATAFIKDSKIELQKVVWPSKQETIQTTSIVMVMVLITGFVLWGVDAGMTWAIGKITQLG